MDYNVRFTDTSKPPIEVQEADQNDSDTDLIFPGRVKLEYGEQVNENLIKLLEKFACPATDATIYPSNPDIAQTTGTSLENPVQGQLWFNSTNNHLYIWENEWVPLAMRGDYAANWGQVASGEQLPKPVSYFSGYEFQYSECIWAVSPASFPGSVTEITCATDSNATVFSEYTLAGSGSLVFENVANYLIIGIRGSTNVGQDLLDPIE